MKTENKIKNRGNNRILAKEQLVSNDTWVTGINNNDLIIGPSGAGKTRYYVKPNILQANESMIIADTKGNLCREMEPYLVSQGYTVHEIDFIHVENSKTGYNPFDYVEYNPATGEYNEQDLMTLCACVCPPTVVSSDPYWENAARMYLECLAAFVMECLPKREQNLSVVSELLEFMGSNQAECDAMFDELCESTPSSIAAKKYMLIAGARKADKTDSSIRAVLMERINLFLMNCFHEFFLKRNKIDFSSLGKQKTAVFLKVSDNDRSKDQLVNLFYTQALQGLIRCADEQYEDNRLPVPVRFILDDFATNTVIPHFDNIISVIRSREIYVSIIIQSLTQLEGLYGHAKATTIINNCDSCLYLGGQDVETARYMGIKSNKTTNAVLNMGLQQALLYVRGKQPTFVEKYPLTEHPFYRDMCKAFESSKQMQALKDSGYIDYEEELPFA